MSQLKYTVDIVMCIDATGSMHPVIGRVKDNALKFYEDLKAHMESKSKSIDTLRVRVIAYRDYYNDGDKAMLASPFFTLPDEKEDFADFINDVEADGGGDEPECGLEALALAIKSEWNKTGDKRRQIIVIWTDASTHPLEKNAGSKPSNYPTNMAKDLNELTDWWEGQYEMSKAAKRLIIYSPDAYAWSDIATNWTNTIQYPSKAGNGLEEHEYQAILDAIAASV
jgi:hypothetical protein